MYAIRSYYDKIIAKSSFLGIPYILWIAIGCFALTMVLLKSYNFV